MRATRVHGFHLCFHLCLLAAAVSPAAAGELQIAVTNVTEARGSMMIQLLPSKAAMAGDERATAALIVPAAMPATRVTVGAVPAGRYAVRVMQDLDGDEALATNLVGMPKEPWGFSNGARGRFGPPSFDDAAFEVGEAPLVVEIELQQ